MTCIANNELLEYLDNEIDANLCREIELHLKGCAECRDESESLKEAQTLWRNTLSPHGLTSDFHIRVKNRLSRTVFRRRVLGLAMAGAAAVWMLIVILVVINSSGKNLPVPQEPTTSGNEIASRADKQTVAVEQPITVTPITDAIAIQTEKDHFHILHKKHPMLSILVKMVRRQVSTGDNTGVKEVTAELTKLLVDTDDEIRAIAAASLGELHATGSIPELVKLLNDKYAGARGWAAIALTELGAKDKVSKDAIADIKTILNNSDDNYRTRAQNALEILKSKKED